MLAIPLTQHDHSIKEVKSEFKKFIGHKYFLCDLENLNKEKSIKVKFIKRAILLIFRVYFEFLFILRTNFILSSTHHHYLS